MIITLIASGSRGDVQPYIALGRGLQRAGHAVRFVTPANYEASARAHGLEVWPIAGDIEAIVRDETMRDRVEGGNFLRLMAQMAKAAKSAAVDQARPALAAGRGADLLLGGLGGLFTGLAVAEKLDLPFMQAHVLPFLPTGDFPAVLAPPMPRPPGRRLNRLTHHLTRQMVWQGFRSADGIARREALAMPRAPLAGPYNAPRMAATPVLLGYSPAVAPRAADWDDRVHVTGYWFLDEEGWTPPPDLVDFLNDGPPPVYVGFGSMSNRDPAATGALVVEALRRAGQRAVVMSGWGGLSAANRTGDIYAIDSVPHNWLFPRVAAVVHHGGAGTTAAGLRAGVPSVVVPFFGDQPYWGRRVAALGVGPAPIPRQRLTVERLAAALAATADEGMRGRAAELGARIRAEDGIARAVAVVGAYAGVSRSSTSTR